MLFYPEVCGSNLDDCSSRLWLRVLVVLRLVFRFRLILHFRRGCRFLRPYAIDTSAISRKSGVVAEENAAGFKRIIGPGVVAEAASPVAGTRQNDDLLTVLRIAPTVIKENVDGAVGRISGEPLKKLFRSVMYRVVVYADRRRPVLAAIAGGRDKNIEIAVAVIAPGYDTTACFSRRWQFAEIRWPVRASVWRT